MMKPILVIVAHGSAPRPTAVANVFAAARTLAERADVAERFARVEARFLDQPPFLDDTSWDAEAVIVPFFMSEGYFVREVLPTRVPPDARITRALGTLALDEVVLDIVHGYADDPALLLVGHGTRRNPDSGATVEQLAARLRSRLRHVSTGFVDQDPALDSAWERLPAAGDVVVVPYFAFAGPHVTGDIPDGLGLADALEGPHAIGGRRVFYAPPVGAHGSIPERVLSLL